MEPWKTHSDREENLPNGNTGVTSVVQLDRQTYSFDYILYIGLYLSLGTGPVFLLRALSTDLKNIEFHF